MSSLLLSRTLKLTKIQKYIKWQKEVWENVVPLLNGASALGRQDMEKTELLNVFFSSVLTSKTGLQKCQAPEIRGKYGAT